MSDTQQIKDKIDIVDLISEYVQLRPAGINHKGCCPFHQEKTPSFMVSRDRQSFHCFGCGKGGDIFTFVEEIEGMEFLEALKHLADRAGVVLTRQTEDPNKNQKNRLKEVNSEAARFFYNFLTKMPASQSARAYLQERGVTGATIDEWQIGYVANQWDLLTQYLLKKGLSIDDLMAAGLTIKRDGADMASGRGFYDRFRGRIMFPIWDINGSVVGFTGRQLVPDDQSGKYVNTPQTPIFDKSRVVFGLNKAKQEIRTQDLIVMVEGQMDVIACHQAGMKNVVATSGTALTVEQIKLLSRYSKNISMAFDADSAGESAARRGIRLAIEAGMNVKVIQIPEGQGKDPDECIKQNKDNWFSAVKNARVVMEWYFERAFARGDLKNPKDKQAIASAILPEIAVIPYAVEKDHWLKELSARLGVEMAVIRDDLKRVSQADLHPVKQQPVVNQISEPKKLTRLDLLSERLLVLVLRFPEEAGKMWPKIMAIDLSTVDYGPLYLALDNEYNTSRTVDVDKLRQNAQNTDEKENLVDILLMKGELDFSNIKGEEAKTELSKTIEMCATEKSKALKLHLQTKIEQAERNGDTAEMERLIKQFESI